MPDTTYTHGHHDSVLRSHRWRTVANSAAYLMPHLVPGVDLLDVGCGPGTITCDMARAVAPGRVVGVDAAAGVIEEAREAAAVLAAEAWRDREEEEEETEVAAVAVAPVVAAAAPPAVAASVADFVSSSYAAETSANAPASPPLSGWCLRAAEANAARSDAGSAVGAIPRAAKRRAERARSLLSGIFFPLSFSLFSLSSFPCLPRGRARPGSAP